MEDTISWKTCEESKGLNENLLETFFPLEHFFKANLFCRN